MTQKDWTDSITTDIQKATTNYLAVVWYIGFVGVMYQLVGLMANERETGMSDLVESMMPNSRRWEPQLARLVAHHLAFSISYGPGWLLMSIIAKVGLFPHTSGGVLVIFFIISGLSITSCSTFGASFFKKSQLSGISTVVIALTLGIVAQIMAKHMDSATVGVLGLLFNPMTFVFLLALISRWESAEMAANLSRSAPGSLWTLPGIVLLVFLIVQIILYPLLAVYVERWLYGTASKRSRRHVSWDVGESSTAIKLTNFKKIYQKNFFLLFMASLFRRKLNPIVAADNISLTALKGQILVLVGPNGCGKTTILNAIAGLSTITGGSIAVDGSGGIGLCPQKNVLWDRLTVEQHAAIFHTLKTTTPSNMHDDANKLVSLCGLQDKRKSMARTLSGGQKRKLQLIMMLTGGSRVCCVDEVSGGFDPLSRRRVWDILLSERGRRTFILTTHFLDEAEYLADHMAIILKGHLRAEGSTSELKERLGSGYRFSIPPGTENSLDTELVGLSDKLHAEQTFNTSDPALALEKIKAYKSEGVKNYQIAGPTIEEVFMKLAVDEDEVAELREPLRTDEVSSNSPSPINRGEKVSAIVTVVDDKGHDTALLTGRHTSTVQQVFTLFQKRLKILRWNWVAYLVTLLIPVVAAGFVSMILKHFQNPGCASMDQISVSDIQSLSQSLNPEIVVGPPKALTPEKLQLFYLSLAAVTQILNETSLLQSIHLVNSLDNFDNFTTTNYSTIVPGGLFLGSNGSIPTFDYRSNIGIFGVYSAIFMQNAMDVLLSNQSIVTQYGAFNLNGPEHLYFDAN
jgi:ATP-binding cassette subfamily A (ABC1) protein 3